MHALRIIWKRTRIGHFERGASSLIPRGFVVQADMAKQVLVAGTHRRTLEVHGNYPARGDGIFESANTSIGNALVPLATIVQLVQRLH